MGFPVCYSENLLPKIFLYLLSSLSLIRKLLSLIFRVIGLPDFLEPDSVSSPPSWPEPPPLVPTHPDPIAILAAEILPVVKFSDLTNRPESDTCAVCLTDFENDDEIRRLTNCRHIFHRGCVDRWMMGYNRMTCPLCRTQVIPDEVQMEFNQKMILSEESEVGGDYEVLDELY